MEVQITDKYLINILMISFKKKIFPIYLKFLICNLSMKPAILFIFFILFTINLPSQDLNGQLDENRRIIDDLGISLVLPPEFKETNKSGRFLHQASGTSLIVYKTDQIAYQIYKDSLNERYFNSQNLILLQKEFITEGEMDGYLFECSTVINEVPFTRLFFVTGDINQTILVIVNLLTKVYDEIYPTIYNSFLTLRDGE